MEKPITVSICIIVIEPLMDICDRRHNGLTMQRELLPQFCDHAVLILVWAAPEHDGRTQGRARLILTQMSRKYRVHWRHQIHGGLMGADAMAGKKVWITWSERGNL